MKNFNWGLFLTWLGGALILGLFWYYIYTVVSNIQWIS